MPLDLVTKECLMESETIEGWTRLTSKGEIAELANLDLVHTYICSVRYLTGDELEGDSEGREFSALMNVTGQISAALRLTLDICSHDGRDERVDFVFVDPHYVRLSNTEIQLRATADLNDSAVYFSYRDDDCVAARKCYFRRYEVPKKIDRTPSWYGDAFRICISSPPDREVLVAEVFFGDEQWAEINVEKGVPVIELYPRQDGQPWQFEYEFAMKALQDAGNRLLDPDRQT